MVCNIFVLLSNAGKPPIRLPIRILIKLKTQCIDRGIPLWTKTKIKQADTHKIILIWMATDGTLSQSWRPAIMQVNTETDSTLKNNSTEIWIKPRRDNCPTKKWTIITIIDSWMIKIGLIISILAIIMIIMIMVIFHWLILLVCHSISLLIPSSKPILGCHPNNYLALLISAHVISISALIGAEWLKIAFLPECFYISLIISNSEYGLFPPPKFII